MPTVHPQSASAVAARRRAGEASRGANFVLTKYSSERSVADETARATRSATAADANASRARNASRFVAESRFASSSALTIEHTSGRCSSANNASLLCENSARSVSSGTRGNRATDARHEVPRHPQLGSWFSSSLGAVRRASAEASPLDAVGGTANSSRALHDSHSSVSGPTHVQPRRAQSTGRIGSGLANQTAGRNVATRRR